MGSDKTFTFTPNSGYKVNSINIDNKITLPAASSYTFRNVTGSHGIGVNFSPISTEPSVTPVISTFSSVPSTTFGYDYDINWTTSSRAKVDMTVDCTGISAPETLTYNLKATDTGNTIACPLQSVGLNGRTIIQGHDSTSGTLRVKKVADSKAIARFTLTAFSPTDASVYDQKNISVTLTPLTTASPSSFNVGSSLTASALSGLSSFPAGCTSTQGYSITTGQSCSSTY